MKAAFAYAARVPLRPNEKILLLYMALVSLDQDSPPRYFGAREESAFALGRLVPDAPDSSAVADEEFKRVEDERKAAFAAVRSAIDGLVKIGAVDRVRHANGARRAEFALRLDPDFSLASEEAKARTKDRRRAPRPVEVRDRLAVQQRARHAA